MILVIMAAGMGSRFGGLKQIQPIDEDGNFIIDYSIFDAIKIGFDKVVIVVKRENINDFKQTIGKRIEDKIKTEYVFQDTDSFVDNKKDYNFENRSKPWGTAHAVLCASEKTDDNFVLINADDFYGRSSLQEAYDYLKSNKQKNNFAIVSYKVNNTLTENGAVKRGICNIENGNLTGLTESIISKENTKIVATPVGSCNSFTISPETLVSMNLFAFSPEVFDYLKSGFNKFLQDNKKDLSTCEYFIPTILSQYIKDGQGNLKVLTTNEKWYGLTYKQDYENVKNGLLNLKKQGVYPEHLWF